MCSDSSMTAICIAHTISNITYVTILTIIFETTVFDTHCIASSISPSYTSSNFDIDVHQNSIIF